MLQSRKFCWKLIASNWTRARTTRNVAGGRVGIRSLPERSPPECTHRTWRRFFIEVQTSSPGSVSLRACFWPGIALTGVLLAARSPYLTNQNVTRDQPIQFSHKHHVGDDGIDCRYCHTAVESSATAGVPPTKTCMNCHSVLFNNVGYLEPVRESYRTDKSIHWVRVHRLAGLRLFQSQHSRGEGRGLLDVPRDCRSDAADFPGVAAEHGLVHRLPPQSGGGAAAAGSGVQHGVEGAGKPGGTGRAVCTRAQDSLDGGSDKLLDVPSVGGM